MNKNRKPATSQERKKMAKQIKKGQKALESVEDLPRTDSLTPRKALKKYPAKRQKVEKPLMDAVNKEMQIKKKQKHAKHSKRTTPGEVEHRETPPAHIHPENERWKTTLDLQNKGKQRAITTKLQRRESKRGK